MKKITLTTSALAIAALLGACASGPIPAPPELVQARESVRTAEADPRVLADAPMELKRATDALNRANMLLADGKSLGEVSSAAYVADRNAKTAMEVARAKRSDAAIRGAELDRERTRADISTDAARRAQAQANVAGARAANAEVRANSAEAQAAVAQANAADAQQQAALLQQQTLALQQELTQMQAKATDRGMLVTLGDVLFETGKADVRPAAQGELAKLADFLKQHPERRILIEGYTDNVGGSDYNVDLSRRRAASVGAALVALGVQAGRIDSAGYGKDYPVADNGNASNRALNRRVEVYISNNAQPVQPRRG